MIMNRLRVLGLVGLEDVDITFQHPVTVVTGGPASGKTTLLLSIVSAVEQLAPTGAQAIQLFSDPPGTGVKLALSFSIEGLAAPIECEIIQDSPMTAEVEVPRGINQVFAWNQNRRLVLIHENRYIDPNPGAATTAMLREPTSRKHAGLLQFLTEVCWDPGTLDPLQWALASACPDLRVFPGARRGESVRFSRAGKEVLFQGLTDSERAALVLCAEVLRSGAGQSLVLIDTIERSISPAATTALVSALPRLAPSAQFVMTTRFDDIAGSHQRIHLNRPRRS